MGSSKFYNFVHILWNDDGQFKYETMMNNSNCKREYIIESFLKFFCRKKISVTYTKLLRGWDMDVFPQWLEFNTGKWCKTPASKLLHPWDVGTRMFILKLPWVIACGLLLELGGIHSPAVVTLVCHAHDEVSFCGSEENPQAHKSWYWHMEVSWAHWNSYPIGCGRHRQCLLQLHTNIKSK